MAGVTAHAARGATRRLLSLACIGMVTPVLADARVPEARRAEAKRLLDSQAATLAADIAGFNRRNALCDARAAATAAAFDKGHRAVFRRTLAFRWDAASSRWVATTSRRPEVSLTLSGPVRSGTVTIVGQSLSFCRAEAPDRLETTAFSDIRNGTVAPKRYAVDVPASAKILGAAGSLDRYVGVEAATPRADTDARVAKAEALLDEQLRHMDEMMADNRKEAKCDEPTAKGMASESNGKAAGVGGAYLRHDTRGWERTTDSGAEVVLVIRGTAYSGLFQDGIRKVWLCSAIEPRRVTTSAMWQAEGDNVLTFTADVQQPFMYGLSSPHRQD